MYTTVPRAQPTNVYPEKVPETEPEKVPETETETEPEEPCYGDNCPVYATYTATVVPQSSVYPTYPAASSYPVATPYPSSVYSYNATVPEKPKNTKPVVTSSGFKTGASLVAVLGAFMAVFAL